MTFCSTKFETAAAVWIDGYQLGGSNDTTARKHGGVFTQMSFKLPTRGNLIS